MKKRLLAFFLAFAMMVSLMPVSTFAAEEPEAHFTGIVTDSGEEPTVEYVKTVTGETMWSEALNTPYYHVTIPEGTENVLVTYPKDTAFVYDGSDESNALFYYMNAYPGQSEIGYGGTLPITVNDDGSKSVVIPVENFLVDENGYSMAVGMAYQVDEENKSAIDFFDFVFATPAPVSHAVTLTAGEGYTLTGEATVEDGTDYAFTLSVEDGYEKTEAFAVKANGEVLMANADGSYTVNAVSADLTITVEGVAKKQEASTKRFTAIVTDDGKEVSAEFKGMLHAETYKVYNDGPYYHVTVPAGTKSVLVTYPADVNIAGGSAAYFYTMSVPDYVMGFGNGSLDVTTNSDGSKTMTIPVAPYLLDDSGKGTAASAEYSVSFDPITFFSFAYEGGAAVSYNVTLTAGDGYTLTGEAAVEEGKDYTFTVAIAEGYEKTEAFAVKANGEVLAANADGSYTVKAVSADLTITVEGVAKKQTVPEALFTSIVTDSGKEVTAEYQSMVPAKSDYASYADAPYYHVTLPAGTASVQITYPASVDMMGVSSAYGYTLTIPKHVLGWTSSGFAFVTNSDGSKTVTIPVANYLLDAEGQGTAVSVEYNSYDPIEFFTFAYAPTVTHKVYLSSGSGYTLTGEDTVEDGADYTFTLSIADGYGKADNFSVTANGVELTANEDGTYTVKNVTADLRISVSGVFGAYTVYLPESDGYVLTDYATGEVLSGSFKLAMTKSYKIKVTLKDGYAVRGNDYGVDYTVGMIAHAETFDGYAVITIVTVTGDGRIFINGVKKIVNVTLPEGEGYTVAPTKDTSDPVLSGDFYYFSVTVAEGYEKTEAFAVKANGKTLTANESGNYTAGNFGTDLTITVEGVAKKQTAPEVLFTSIVTDSGKEVTAEYQRMVPAKNDYASYADAPYYHVTLPAGTASVQITYPASVDMMGVSSAYGYTLTIPEHVLGWTSSGFAFVTNSDGSKTVTIPVANYLLDAEGQGTAVSVEYNSYDPIEFFTFAYESVVSYDVTLTPGEGYTLTGADTVEEGEDYTFSLSVAEGYYESAAFAVKADDKALTANEDGTYTVAKVAANVTITVEGVQKKPENGLSAVKFTVSSGSTARAYDITPAFDPAVKEYTILAPDSDTALYAWATMSKGMSSKGTIKAEWVSLTGSTSSTKTQAIKSGGNYGQSLSGVVIAGDKTCSVTLKIEDGAYTDSYTFTTVRTDPTLKSLELVNVALNKTFSSATKNYTATTADESVTVKLEPKGSSYTVTINGKTDKTVALEMGENVIEIVVQNARGEKNTYTVTVTRVEPVTVTLDMNPANAKVTLTDAKGKKIEPDSTGAYHLMSSSTYYYTATASGYKRTTGSFTPTVSGPVSIALDKDTAQPVTVYFSFSHDEKFEFCEETGEVMALKKITVPYFDLANYGMEDFYFSSESYGSVDPENPGAGSDLEPGTAEFAYGKITMLHLFIYATEVYRCGIDPADAGQGYLLDSGLLGQDIFSYSGSVGSIFLNTIWDYDLNLNHEYPLASGGWGSTCDQILLHDDDVVTLGHFTDWSFFNDSTSVFNHFESDTAAPVQGDQFTLSVIRDGADMYGTYNTAHTPVTYNPDIYCARVDEIYDGDVTTWTYVGTADDEGQLVVDTTDLAPGEYVFAMAGQPGAENPSAICSTPGGMRITIQAKPVIKGDVDGDGTVDAVDVTALYNALTNGSALDAAVSDINGDGVVDVFDVMALYASVAGGK